MHKIALPTNVVSIYNHALELSNRGEFRLALNEYKKAIEVYPSFIEAYNNIGEIYSRIGESKLAISTFYDALKINRNHNILLNLGVEYYNNKDFETSLKHFLESVSLKQNFLEGNFYTGLTYYNLKNFEDAKRYLFDVVQLEKEHKKANYLLSYIHYEWKEYEKTLLFLDNIKDIGDQKSFINKYYGFCHYFLGRYDKALEYLTTALESQPEYDKYRDFLKNLTYENKLKEIGDIDRAIQDLEGKIMKDKPIFTEVSRLSMLYIFQGKSEKAEELLLDAKKKMFIST